MTSEYLTQILGELLISARPGQESGRRLILAESTAFVDQLMDESLAWVEPSTLILVPGAAGEQTLDARISPSGDEISLRGECYLSLVEYSIAPFMPIVGPTLLTVNSEADLSAFLYDADKTRESGRFPLHLIHSAIELSSACALVQEPVCRSHSMRQLFVSADGEVACARNGRPVGTVEEGIDAAIARAEAMPCAERCLGAVLGPETLDAAVADRPWLGLYLAVGQLMRANGLQPEETLALGFGPLTGGVIDTTTSSLVRSGQGGYTVSASGRAVRVGRDSYRYLESYLRTGSHNDAIANLVDGTGIELSRAEAALEPVSSLAHQLFPEAVGR